MKKGNEVIALVQSDLNQEGIKTQLTQNDLIEVVVEERYKEIMKRFDSLAEERKNIINAISFGQIENDHKDTFINKYKKLYNIDNVKSFSIWNSRTDKNESVPLCHINIHRIDKKTDNIGLGTSNITIPTKNSHLSFSLDLALCEQKKDETITLNIRLNTNIKIPKNHPSLNIKDRIIKYNEDATAFAKEVAGVNMNYESLTREIRTSFNKKLIVNGSPKLSEKIKEVFKIDLK